MRDDRYDMDGYGWNTNIYSLSANQSWRQGDLSIIVKDTCYIDVIGPDILSKPCWLELNAHSQSCERVEFRYNRGESFDPIREELVFRPGKIMTGYAFVIQGSRSELLALAAKVQAGAKNKRKDRLRQQRLMDTGSFHTESCLNHLYEIQQGKCYYSGEPLTKAPSNYSKDHIIPVCQGGTDWPGNLALTLKPINTWKGAKSKETTLHWLARTRGNQWLMEQIAFCGEIDKLRAQYQAQFMTSNEYPWS